MAIMEIGCGIEKRRSRKRKRRGNLNSNCPLKGTLPVFLDLTPDIDDSQASPNTKETICCLAGEFRPLPTPLNSPVHHKSALPNRHSGVVFDFNTLPLLWIVQSEGI